MSDMAMKYEDWLRECVRHDGRIVYLPCDIVLAIADWMEAHRDAVPVLRCKDCKCWTEWSNGAGSCSRFALDWIGTDATDFCSFAERRDDDTD